MTPFVSMHPIAAALAALSLAAAGAAFAAAPAVAQGPLEVQPPDVRALVAQAKELARQEKDFAIDRERLHLALEDGLMGLPPSMAFAGSELGRPQEIVKNAPYTAEAVTESIQVLPDGNRIVRKSTTLLARDTQGRTRQERKGEGAGGVFIYDPMEGRTIVLNEGTRTAIRLPRLPEPPVTPAPGAAPPVPPVPPAPLAGKRDVEVQPGRVVVRRNRTGDGDDVHVEVIRISRGDGDQALPLPPAPPMPPLALPTVPRGKGETKSLGTREFDGIKAEGTLTTHTIPAGRIGNEKPIVVASERWFSPDLFVVVYAKTSDPRAGDTVYRLTSVKRGEPPAELFRIPADYRNRGDTLGPKS